MKRRRITITDLNFDVLKHIMFHVAYSSNGAVNVARAACVCKAFRESSQEVGILTKTNFDGLKLPIVGGSFWKDNGLLKKCACVGNLSVLCLLLKNLLERTGSLMELKDLARVIEMRLLEETERRYCTRSRMRAVDPFLKIARRLIIILVTDCKEIQEILGVLQAIKRALHSKQEGISQHYRRIISLVEELENFIVSELNFGERVLSVFHLDSVYDKLIPKAL